MSTATHGQTAQAILGGGCFWCLDAVFREMAGVVEVESGYCGGSVAQPSYVQVCTGDTGHAEVVRIRFDPAQVSFRDLLEVFFAIHDPTTKNRQGYDIGSQYRSVIFHADDAQLQTARALIAELASTFDDPIVTELAPAAPFHPAEIEHQDYYALHSEQPYCRVVVSPKLAKFRSKFAARRAS